MLELREVTKQYSSVRAVDGVSFRLAPGEVVGYLGPNGAGKSTTVKMIVGLLEPTSGEVCFRGERIEHDLPAYRRRLGYVPEEPQVYSYLSGLEYLELVGRLRSLDDKTLSRRAHDLLQLFSLHEFRDVPLGAYSKGMKQRLLLASALLHNPDLLVLDEPLSGLDVTAARVIKDLFVELAVEGKAILYISHVLEVVEKVCARVVVIDKGRVLADAPVAELKHLAQTPSLEGVFAQLVQQEDTRSVARQIAMAVRSGA